MKYWKGAESHNIMKNVVKLTFGNKKYQMKLSDVKQKSVTNYWKGAESHFSETKKVTNYDLIHQMMTLP